MDNNGINIIKKIGIIGGSGALGGWFGKWFHEHGFEVILHGRNLERLKKAASSASCEYTQDISVAVKDVDLIMVSVPIKNTPRLLKTCAELAKGNTIIFEVASVKDNIIKELRDISEKFPVSCVSTHPMFGPGAKGLKDKKIILIDLPGEKNKKSKEILRKIFTLDDNDKPVILECSPEEHDKKMSLVLGLPHTINILFLNILSNSGFSLDTIAKFGGTTFKIQKILSESVIKESPEIYSQIQMNNPQFLKILKSFSSILHEYIELIEEQNYDNFESLFENLNEYAQIDDDFINAYEKFYGFLESLSNFPNKK